MALLQFLTADVQIYIFSFLTPPEILNIRKTCSQIYAISKLRSVWTNACDLHIIRAGWPFTAKALQSMSVSELEYRTCRAYHLGSRWLSGISIPRRALEIDATSGTSVSEIRFLPGYSGRFILTISKAIWDMLCIWDTSNEGRKACEWSPKGAIFNGVALNTDPNAEATIALSVFQNVGVHHSVQLLSLQVDANGVYSLHLLHTIESNLRPTYLNGDTLGISDNASRTEIRNWKAGTSAVLQGHQSEGGIPELDRTLQLTYAHQSVLVVKEASLVLFPKPELREEPYVYEPLAQHTLSWVDSVSATLTRSASPPSLSILLRGLANDQWSRRFHTLSFYTLQPSLKYDNDKVDHLDLAPSDIPYIFPPILVEHIPSFQGSIHCRNAVLGPCNTAVWIQPRDRAVAGLTSYESEIDLDSDGAHECLVIAAFPGPLLQTEDSLDSRAKVIYTNNSNNWQSLDYDEESGHIALCSSFGKLLVIKI